MRTTKMTLWMLPILAVLVPGLQAAVIFTEDFDSYPGIPFGGYTTVTNGNFLGLWAVTAGSIDLLNNYPGLPCYSGTQCLDMDGTTSAAGTITRNFSYTAGTTYVLTFWYRGSNRGPDSDTMTVTLGDQSTNLSVPYNQSYTMGSLTFSPVANGTGAVTFAHHGADKKGILLDDIKLESRDDAQVPEPATWALMAGGLLLAGLLRRR